MENVENAKKVIYNLFNKANQTWSITILKAKAKKNI